MNNLSINLCDLVDSLGSFLQDSEVSVTLALRR